MIIRSSRALCMSRAAVVALLFGLLQASCVEREDTGRAPLRQCLEPKDDVFVLADVPSGACSPDTTPCKLETNEPCPDGSMGGTVRWNCACQRGQWHCGFEVGEFTTFCEDAADAGS